MEIAYFTANLKQDANDPGVQDRQRLYHRALRTIPNLEIFLGRYISKKVSGELLDPDPGESPKRTVRTYEEKGTDVNLAARLLADGFTGRYESAAVISNDGDLKMPIQIVRQELGLHVTVVNPVLHSRHRSAALSPDPLPANASFIRLSTYDVEECQFPDELTSPKGARLVKPPPGELEIAAQGRILQAIPLLFRQQGARPPSRRPRHFRVSNGGRASAQRGQAAPTGSVSPAPRGEERRGPARSCPCARAGAWWRRGPGGPGRRGGSPRRAAGRDCSGT